jgi:hypothetical protein
MRWRLARQKIIFVYWAGHRYSQPYLYLADDQWPDYEVTDPSEAVVTGAHGTPQHINRREEKPHR